MLTNPDWRDRPAALNDAGAEFLVVEVQLLPARDHVRPTKALDLSPL